jgi:hypothetical protein
MAVYQAGLDEEEKEIERAWDRVKSLGYVDNASSLILGIDPGTLSYEAQKAKDEREQELQMQRNTINAQQTQEKMFKDNIYRKLNNGIPLTPEEANFVGTNPEGNVMAKAITAAQKDPNWLNAYDDEERDQLIDYYYKKYTGEGDSIDTKTYAEPFTGPSAEEAGFGSTDALPSEQQAFIDDLFAKGYTSDEILKAIDEQRDMLQRSGASIDGLKAYARSKGR